MTNEDNWRYVFRKHPDVRFNRANAYWKYGEYFYGFRIYAMKGQLMEFFKDYAGIERSCREVLKEEEFRLPILQDSKIREKQAQYRKEWKPKDIKEQADFNKAFNYEK